MEMTDETRPIRPGIDRKEDTMRIFVAGASGAIGTRLVAQLVDRGHVVIGSSRSPHKSDRLHALGAEPVVLDLLDRDAVLKAVVDAKPDAIVHEATALAGVSDYRHFDRSFAQTNRLRTEGTDALLAAADEAGVPRFVAQSFAGNRYERRGGRVKTEDDPLDSTPVPAMRETVAAMRYLDEVVTGTGGIALRYGGFYGDPDDALVDAVRKRKFPVVGDGGGIVSFVQLDDAASATVLALEGDAVGVYNIVDDEPAPLREWLPALAKALGAKPPRHFPPGAGPALRGRGGGHDDDRGAGRLEREGEARARLDPALPQLAAGLRRDLRLNASIAAGSDRDHGGRERSSRPPSAAVTKRPRVMTQPRT
jgi:nucleoside-diphosphate-sugar epimerase